MQSKPPSSASGPPSITGLSRRIDSSRGSGVIFSFSRDPFNFEIFQRLVDDDPHCTIGIMFANVDHGTTENRILESRHGNKKVML